MNEYVLKLTDADLAAIDMGLQEVKMRIAAPVVAKINAQIAAQKKQQDEKNPRGLLDAGVKPAKVRGGGDT